MRVDSGTTGDPGWPPYGEPDGAVARIAEKWTVVAGGQRTTAGARS
jgi:hypothetical protein